MLVFLNKRDLPSALERDQCVGHLGLFEPWARGIEWHAQECVATAGEGLVEGFSWLHNAIRARYIESESRQLK